MFSINDFLKKIAILVLLIEIMLKKKDVTQFLKS